jgi:Rrf2 family protein
MTLISQTSEYALRAMLYLAGSERRMSVHSISEAVDVPTAYLGKVLKHLVRAGLVTARRGPGGGVALARPTSRITLLDIVNAVDPVEHVHRCPLRHKEDDARLCPLHEHLESAIRHVEEAFRATSLADLTRNLSATLSQKEKIEIDR